MARLLRSFWDPEVTCPSVRGYVFYRWQEVSDALTLAIINPPGTPASLVVACNGTRFCNAFNTSGALLLLPIVAVFSPLAGTETGSSGSRAQCDGIYVGRRTLSGLTLPVSAKLQELGHDIRDFASLPQSTLSQAFAAAATPLAQTSEAMGSYAYGDVLAALSFPIWDSRNVTGTSYNLISPVKDQGSCGSCVSFAVAAMAEAAVGAVSLTTVNNNDFSEQWLFFCNGMFVPSCEYGWFARDATTVVVNKNIPYEVNFPYLGIPGCTLRSPPLRYAGGMFWKTTFSNLTLAKQHIRMYGSVTSYFAVYTDFLSWTASSPPYIWNRASLFLGYHQVLVMGYSDEGSYWIIKNSWGTNKGDKGYYRISYNAGVGFMSVPTSTTAATSHPSIATTHKLAAATAFPTKFAFPTLSTPITSPAPATVPTPIIPSTAIHIPTLTTISASIATLTTIPTAITKTAALSESTIASPTTVISVCVLRRRFLQCHSSRELCHLLCGLRLMRHLQFQLRLSAVTGRAMHYGHYRLLRLRHL
ncbi:hypothetical protein VOLCADRAFT_97816 [Volvox carteri f. nagariensis]|uniref:Peptidase C1A papain C-terminal domain-containing protein n=1 Tax=Volvox carteri f. nagariensis TaxID=3068 RepID=D8UDQ0_VOLCA|nr:uncharacterized protein VOLCADRAFT_97816 [Volvox carteri f. nagariensis]EFJ42081.1 hypothetical protein VOLCADRAFT_97816 [Volvox carteri f. nagariensis]|eukprot:XP_002956778.1 hypothetical protein VOLCADRAFT_97816 [Volvox carteri f. nagariensis]